MESKSIELIFDTWVPSSKNNYAPRSKKSGGRALMKDPAVAEQLKRVASCIPEEYRKLYLLHPDVEVRYRTPTGAVDKNNIWTTLLDVMVQSGVLWNDSIASFNGEEFHHKAETGDWEIRVTLIGGEPQKQKLIDQRTRQKLMTAAKKKLRRKK